MKSLLLNLLAIVSLASPVLAADDHGHSHAKKSAGPNGGRILEKIEPHAEFLVLPDRKVQITFLGEDGKPAAAKDQVVTVTAGDRTAPTRLTFVKSGNALVSEQPLPEGNALPAVVQIKTSAEGKLVVEKFNIDLTKCSECDKAEYACICTHGDSH